ncbi:hypothetical protein Tco_0335405, partial [Tanacetum coccineum]
MDLRAELMKFGLVSVNTARQVNAAHSKTTVNAVRPMCNTFKDKNVNTAKPKAVVNAAKPKAVVNVVKGNNVNAVKASACWVWKPKTKVKLECEQYLQRLHPFLLQPQLWHRFYHSLKFQRVLLMLDSKPSNDDEKKVTKEPGKEGGDPINAVGRKASIELPDEPNMPALEDIVYSDNDDDVSTEANVNNLDAFMPVRPILTTRVHKDHPVEQIIGDLNLAPQTIWKNHGLFSSVQQRTNHKGLQNCLFACFVSQVEPKK